MIQQVPPTEGPEEDHVGGRSHQRPMGHHLRRPGHPLRVQRRRRRRWTRMAHSGRRSQRLLLHVSFICFISFNSSICNIEFGHWLTSSHHLPTTHPPPRWLLRRSGRRVKVWPTSFWNVSLASNCKRNRLSEYRFSCQLKSFDLNAVLLSLKICRKHVVDVTHFCVSNGPLSAHQHSTIDLICHRLEPCNLAGFDWPIVGEAFSALHVTNVGRTQRLETNSYRWSWLSFTSMIATFTDYVTAVK